jgi:RecA-family ATPase
MTHYSDEEIAAALGRLLPKKNTNGGSNTADIPNVALAHLISRCAAEIAPKRIDFTWAGRIARGKHTAIAGEPGDGKSQLSVYIAATVSRGGEWPCSEGRAPIGNVIILNAEDGADDTVVPRLIAAGADLNRIHIVSAVSQGTVRRTFNLQGDLALLEQKITEIRDVALVIIDPISSYMGKTDSHKNAEVRGALEPLSEMAERLQVAILSITHFSKSGTGTNTKALHDEALRATDTSGDRSAATEAEEFLREKLSEGPVSAKEGEEHARALGIAPRTLARARKKLGVVAEKVGLKEGWIWRLPAEDCQTTPKNANQSNGSLRPALAAFDPSPYHPVPDYRELPATPQPSPPPEPPQANGRAPALGPRGDSLDDFQ